MIEKTEGEQVMNNCKKQLDIDITASSDSGKRNVLDLISRLSELRSQYNCFNESERESYHTLTEAIEALQERKTGKWIEKDGFVICSECGEEYGWIVYRANFCENCGADMRKTP